MAATAIFLHFRPHRHRRLLLLHNATSSLHFSSSSNSDDNNQNRTSPSQSQAYFADLKASLKQPSPSPQQPRRPNFIPNIREDPNQKLAALNAIQKNLSEFRRRSNELPSPSPAPQVSFQELYKRNLMQRTDSESGSENTGKRESISMDAIRMSLKKMTPSQSQQSEEARRKLKMSEITQKLELRPKSLNDIPESMEKNKRGTVSNETRTEFVRNYSYADLGEKLKKLRPVNKNKNNKSNKFSLSELDERLRKMREIEEKESVNIGGFSFGQLRVSLAKQEDDNKAAAKENSAKKSVIFGKLGGTPEFTLYPPKEVLVEKYFHPDHMSSAEKQKIELKNVRDKFKISESDCGSSRVQVAQLTTKIKHLATVLHKKDKHSRKGLQAMVQKRKKLLKYLRRTDWDSYCFCLSELGLRDSADYKL